MGIYPATSGDLDLAAHGHTLMATELRLRLDVRPVADLTEIGDHEVDQADGPASPGTTCPLTCHDTNTAAMMLVDSSGRVIRVPRLEFRCLIREVWRS